MHWKFVLQFDDQDCKLIRPPNHFPMSIFWKQDWQNQRIHIQTHFSSFCHVKSWIQCLYQSCSSSFKRYALLLYTMLSSSSWNHSITPQTFWFYLILIFMFPVSKSTVFVLPIAFAAFINQSFALLNSQTPNSYLL